MVVSSLATAAAGEAIGKTAFAGARRVLLVADSVRAAEYVDSESLDFVIIDADHRYEYVKKDVRHWHDKVRVGGLVSGHDYGRKPRVWGVREAVDEFAAEYGYEVTLRPGYIWGFLRK